MPRWISTGTKWTSSPARILAASFSNVSFHLKDYHESSWLYSQKCRLWLWTGRGLNFGLKLFGVVNSLLPGISKLMLLRFTPMWTSPLFAKSWFGEESINKTSPRETFLISDLFYHKKKWVGINIDTTFSSRKLHRRVIQQKPETLSTKYLPGVL